MKEGLQKWRKKADGKCSCDYSFHMSIVEWNEETRKEIQDMIDDQKPIEVNCHFCGKHYEFNVDELKNLLKKAVRA